MANSADPDQLASESPKGKEFAPWVSFLLENTSFQKEVGVEESKQESPKVVSLIKQDSNTVKYI